MYTVEYSSLSLLCSTGLSRDSTRSDSRDGDSALLLVLGRHALGHGVLGAHLGAERLAAVGEDLVKVELAPADLGAEAGELPLAVDLAIPVGVGAVGVALDGDDGARLVRVALVRDAQLVHADDLGVADLLPLGAADEVLRHEQRVAQDGLVRDHGDELFGGHGLP